MCKALRACSLNRLRIVSFAQIQAFSRVREGGLPRDGIGLRLGHGTGQAIEFRLGLRRQPAGARGQRVEFMFVQLTLFPELLEMLLGRLMLG